MLKGGVIMDVVTPEHARIAQEAGACAVMALERVPADIRAEGGVARMADAAKVQDFFLAKFKRPLPVSAFGQSDLHTRWGWDHHNGMDVGLHPDSSEGR